MPPVEYSTVPEVRAYLVERIRAILLDADITDCVVTYGQPPGPIPYFFIGVGSTENGVAQTAKSLPAARARAMQETYDLRLVFWVQAPGDTSTEAQQACTERIWQTFRAVSKGLREGVEAMSLAGLVTAAYFTQVDDDDYITGERDGTAPGRAAQIVASLHVLANRI